MGLLWYWDHQHIRSVENFDFSLSTKDGVVARDGIEITGENFDPSAISQKWEFKAGTITPAVLSTKAEKLIITAQGAKLIVSRQNPDSDGQLFDSEMTQVGKSIGNYCSPDHNPTKTYSSRGNEIIVVHNHKSKSGYDTKWTMNWWSDEDICGETFYSNSGSFSSPGYPNPYPSDRRCE